MAKIPSLANSNQSDAEKQYCRLLHVFDEQGKIAQLPWNFIYSLDMTEA
jgi:hypothetical protein